MEITKNVYALASTKGSYAYLINAEELILIDTSRHGKFFEILKEIRGLGFDPKEIKHILLTHHDIDHIGNARKLQDFTGAKLWISEEDLPFVTGEKNRTGVKRLLQSLIKIDKPKIDKTFTENFPFIDIVPTPGHTPGHVAFLYKKILFTGDLVSIYNGKVNFLPNFFTWDKQILESSLEKIKSLDFEWICPSHGEPIKRKNIQGKTL